MPYHVEWEDRGVYVHFHGISDANEVMAMLEEVAADERFDDLRYHISDYSDLLDHVVVNSQIKEILALEEAQRLSNPMIWCAVVTPDASVRSSLEYWCAAGGPSSRRGVFPTAAAARAWIQAKRRRSPSAVLRRAASEE